MKRLVNYYELVYLYFIGTSQLGAVKWEVSVRVY